jgi:hypothetical protein
MRKLFLFTIVALLLVTSAAYSQSGGSGGGSFSNAFLIPTVLCQAGSTSSGSSGSTSCGPAAGGGPKVLFADFKVSSSPNKNVMLMASLESSILTDTAVASSNGNKSTSTASASLVVTPLVYQCLGTGSTPCSVLSSSPVGTVTPDHVTFNSRVQTLTANLLGLGCTANLTTGVVTCTSPETIELILDTTTANAFNFVVTGLPGAGVYQAQLGAFVKASATVNSLPAGATATIGVGAGSLIDLDVNAETPFTSITLCPGGPSSGGQGPANCGP